MAGKFLGGDISFSSRGFPCATGSSRSSHLDPLGSFHSLSGPGGGKIDIFSNRELQYSSISGKIGEEYDLISRISQIVQWYEVKRKLKENSEKIQRRTNVKGALERKKTTPTKALPIDFEKISRQGLPNQDGERWLSPPGVYTGGRLSAVERPTEPVFWQLKRVRVCAGAY